MDLLDEARGSRKYFPARLRSQSRGRKSNRDCASSRFSIACLHSQVALVSLAPCPACQSSIRQLRGILEDRDGEGPPLLHFQESNWQWEDVSARGLGWLWQSGGTIKGRAPSSTTATFCEAHFAGGEDIANSGGAEGQSELEMQCGFTWHLVE